MTINELVAESYATAKDKGWWEKPREVGTQIALMHSELSEALEIWRVGDNLANVWHQANGSPEGFAVELADCIIRIADTCGHYGIDLEEALRLKLAYNRTRTHRHGGKVA